MLINKFYTHNNVYLITDNEKPLQHFNSTNNFKNLLSYKFGLIILI